MAFEEEQPGERLEGPSQALESGAALEAISGSGEVIGGFRLIRKLGRGAMGIVWEAERIDSAQRVALKVMHVDHSVDENHVRMFRREVEALARLEHPNIAALFDSDHTRQGHDWFAMELVAGPTLDRWLKSRPEPYDAAELELRLRLFSTICETVRYAHRRGVIHRDLKPSNIIVSDPATVKILDFGLASITESDFEATTIPEIGIIKGTLQYMSPEQARCDGEVVGERSDVYSLGVILYEMLTGAHPYGVSMSALAEALRVICEDEPRPIKRHWRCTERLPRDLETIVGKALEKKIDRRYANAAALAGDIDRFLASKPIEARPPSPAYRLRKTILGAPELVLSALTIVVLQICRNTVSAAKLIRRVLFTDIGQWSAPSRVSSALREVAGRRLGRRA